MMEPLESIVTEVSPGVARVATNYARTCKDKLLAAATSPSLEEVFLAHPRAVVSFLLPTHDAPNVHLACTRMFQLRRLRAKDVPEGGTSPTLDEQVACRCQPLRRVRDRPRHQASRPQVHQVHRRRQRAQPLRRVRARPQARRVHRRARARVRQRHQPTVGRSTPASIVIMRTRRTIPPGSSFFTKLRPFALPDRRASAYMTRAATALGSTTCAK